MPIVDERASISLKKLLLATDFSPASERAAGYANAMARRFSSTVEIVHVFDPSVMTAYEEAIVGLLMKERRRNSDESLERVKKEFLASGIDARTASPEGYRPFAALLKVAEEHNVDLIVAGTHSRTGVERFVLGSTAEELIRSAKCPVLTVGPNVRPAADASQLFQTIVCATDFSVESTKAAGVCPVFCGGQRRSSLLLLCARHSYQHLSEEGTAGSGIPIRIEEDDSRFGVRLLQPRMCR